MNEKRFNLVATKKDTVVIEILSSISMLERAIMMLPHNKFSQRPLFIPHENTFEFCVTNIVGLTRDIRDNLNCLEIFADFIETIDD